MPISVKQDIKPLFGFGSRFSLGDTPVVIPVGSGPTIRFRETGGSYLDAVRDRVADRNWDDFYTSWKLQGLSAANTKREVLKAIAGQFSLDDSEEETFDALWDIFADAASYERDVEEELEADLDQAYHDVARIAAGFHVGKHTFARMPADRDDERFVVFSDHHMTKHGSKPDYFKDFNYQLYLDVLAHYATTDFCLIENGDVEECVIYAPTFTDARTRKDQAPGAGKFPIRHNDPNWHEFLDTRYAQRELTLSELTWEFRDYYDLVRLEFAARDKYVRITGNHDTYQDDDRESPLKERVEGRLGANVYDALRIRREGEIAYVVLHGHQFDATCMQHGSTPFAKSLGEVFSETAGWAFQGPDRFWTEQDTKRWYHEPAVYGNTLAVETPGIYQDGGDGIFDLLANNLNQIKSDARDFVETVLDHQVAWEYFENSGAFHALTLEVWTGDELYKMRHTNEQKLCQRYASEFLDLQDPPDLSARIPTLVIGHTHEPRKSARDPGSGAFPYWYLNSGSAGRYANLLWCVEILEDEDRICSWSRIGGRLTKIAWCNEGATLVHDAANTLVL
jgi:predicted phosphodiesterase